MPKTNIPLIDLAPSHRGLEGKLVQAFKAILRKNAFVLGEEVRLFEEAFAVYCGVPHAVGVASGASALSLTLRALGLGPGDEVLTTPFTFYATASAIVEVGAKPVFVDVDPGTFNIDPTKLERATTAKTKALLPVHLFGNPADLSALSRHAQRHKLALVEDAAQAHGARFQGDRVGAWGVAGCFSFYPSKNLGGLGDGGMVTTADAGLNQALRILRNCGRGGAAYEHTVLGFNERLDNLQAAALRIKLKKLDAWTQNRRRLAALYQEELRNTPVRFQAVLPGAEPVFHLLTVRAPRRDALRDYLKGRGIASEIFYPKPLHLQKVFSFLGYVLGDMPEAESAAREVLSLPLYPGLAPAALRRVARAVKAFYEAAA